jgi:hypothetical protein
MWSMREDSAGQRRVKQEPESPVRSERVEVDRRVGGFD